MFKENPNKGQISVMDPSLQFPKYIQEALQKSWAPYFYWNIFKNINEERFSVLPESCRHYREEHDKAEHIYRLKKDEVAGVKAIANDGAYYSAETVEKAEERGIEMGFSALTEKGFGKPARGA